MPDNIIAQIETTVMSRSGRREGGEIRFLCPCHDDHNPSARWHVEKHVWHCDVCKAGGGWKDLAGRLGIDVQPEKYNNNEFVATYDYTDEAGKLLYQVCRMEPKDFRQRRPDGSGGWHWNLKGVQRVLYHLPKVIEAVKNDETVFVVEGEKDVHSLEKIGLVATTNAGGAGKWWPEFSDCLKGANVIILPDNDEPGRKHAEQVAKSLQGRAASVKVLELAGLPEKGDVSDWLAAGGTKEELLKLVQKAPVWVPEGAAWLWEPPMPFTEYNLPPFPAQALPVWLRQYVGAEAEATQTPPDLAGMLALAVCGAAIAKKIAVFVWEGWHEPVNLFTMTALPPGSRKSVVFADVTEPVSEYERELAQTAAPEIEAQKTEKKIIETALAQKQAEAAKAKAGEQEAKIQEATDLARKLAGLQVDAIPRLIADDCSPEKLAGLLAEQGGRMALMSPEGGIFEIMAGRYANGTPNLEVYLKGHAGDDLRVDRIGRPPEYVRAPALTVGLAVQPDVIRGLAQKPGFRGRGLLARFLYSIPKPNIGARKIRPAPVPEHVKAAYRRNVRALLELSAGTNDQGEMTAHALRLDQEAQNLIEDFCRWLEPQLPEQAELGNIQDWASKLAGAVARIAGILHVAEHTDKFAPWTIQISGQTMQAAIALGKYLIPHAKAAFDEMGADPEMDAARYVLEWIMSHETTKITKRDLFQEMRGRFKRTTEIDPALSILEEHGYLRQVRISPPDGGRPSILLEVNPLCTKPSKHSKPPCGDGFEDIEGFEKGYSTGGDTPAPPLANEVAAAKPKIEEEWF